MNEEIQFIVDSAKELMENAVHHLELEFVNIRAGKATPSMLNSVKVEQRRLKKPPNRAVFKHLNKLDLSTL